MAVHLYGQTADMTRIREICRKSNLKLFEDAAQAHGAMHCGAKAGALGDGAGFTFTRGRILEPSHGSTPLQGSGGVCLRGCEPVF